MINHTDNLRALAGIAASKDIDESIKKKAEGLLAKTMDLMEDNIRFEASMMVKAKAEMNGIIS